MSAARAMFVTASLAILLAGCKKTTLDPTSVVVTVSTDLIVGTDLDEIAITVTSARGMETFSFPLASAGDLPVTLALLPKQDRMESFLVTATARLASNDVVSQSLQTSFVPGQVNQLALVLSRSCIGIACPDDQTCAAGACVPRAGGMTPLDAGGGDGPAETPDSGDAGVVNTDLKVQYETMEGDANTQSINPFFKIVNMGDSAYALSDLTVRYWFTTDGTTDTLQPSCDYATAGRANVTLDFQPVSPARTNADHYLEVGFTAAAGNLAAGGAQSEIQTRFNTAGFSFTFYQTNDYSFDATKTAYTDWTKVTLYQNGTLIWGVEPS